MHVHGASNEPKELQAKGLRLDALLDQKSTRRPRVWVAANGFG